MQRLHPNPVVHYTVLVLIYSVALVTLFSHTLLHAVSKDIHKSATHHNAAAECNEFGKKVTVRFTSSGVLPRMVEANRCDELEITNNDKESHTLAFGNHDRHQSYPGFDEKELKSGEKTYVSLVETGNYLVHDHLHASSDNSEARVIIN